MSNKITYTIKTADGKEHQVSKENIDKYGIQSYASAYRGATIRMRDSQKGDYDIPLQHFDQARKQGLHAFSIEHTPIQKQAAPKPTVPTPTQTISPRLSTPQGRKPLLSDSFGKASYNLKPQPVGYNLSEEHRKEVLGEQAKRSTNPTNPHVQRAVQLGNEAKAKRVGREQKRFGKPTIVRAFDDAVHGDKKAAKELGMPQVMQQKKDEIDYMQATGKELRNPVDAGLTYDENGDIVHSMFAPTVARDEHGNIVTNDAGEPLVGVSSDEARAKAYGDSVQTGIEAQREKDKVDNLYKDAVESVNDAFDEDYKKKEAFRKEHPFLGAVSDALEGFSNRGNALQYVPEGAKPGLSALSMMTKAAQMKENADRYGDAGTLSRLYGGIMAGLTDVNTYDFGITDTFNAANLYRAAKNYEEGKATAKDKMLLDAAAIANNVQSEASDKLGGAFGAGQNLVGTIGFMAQMATNPASGVGKEAAASVAKTIAKRALQKFGNGAIAKAITGLAKGATRVGMDAVEAGVVTGMYSPTKIVGDYLNRKTGDVQSDGKGGYIFQNKEYSDVKALAKAINGQYAENISEMWGEYLPGMGKVNAAIGRGARKIGLGKVVDAFEHMSSSNWAKTWKNFQERTKWNGMAGEYFEEVANNLYNAVTNGDMTLDTDPHTGVFNPKINLDTFYSVALMSGIMSGVNTAGYARERYKAPHEQHKADAQARSVFGERWDEYKNAIDNADEKQIGSVMEKIGSDKSLSNSQKIAALQYQYRTAVVHGVNAQDTKNKLEGQFNAMDEAYNMGYNLQDEKELNNTAILYDEAKKQATKATGWGEDTLESMIGEDGGASTLAYMKHSDEFNDGQLQAFTDYANARAAYNGMIQRVKDDIDTKVHESNLEAEQRTNLDTGAIHPATMKVDDRQVYIVNGNVVMLPDGSGVDHEHSDDFVVLRDAETGELETADPSAIFKVDAPINVQEEKEAAADNIRQTFAQQQADKIDGKLEFKQGDIYSIIDKEDGTQHSLSIIGDAIDEKIGQVNPEMVLVDIDGAQQPILLPKEQVQQQVDEARRAAVAATQVVENVPTNNTNNTYNINDEVTLSDENGNTVRGSITAPQNEDGKFEVYTEQPINGKKVNLFSAEELDSMTKAPTDVAEKTITQQPQQQEDTENSVEKEAPQQQTTAFERIPKDESGQPLYEQTDPETAWDAIVEQTEGDTSMAQTVADDMVSDLEAGVKKAEKTKTKSGGSIAEKIAAEKKRAEVIEQAKATLAHWKKIAAVNRMREAAIQAEEQRKADEVARVRKEQEETARAEQEEAERIKREALNGVPDFVEDKATDARARGYRRVNGDKVDRQEPINATKGKEVQVKFDDDNIPAGHVAIIEANQLQPSHKNGQRNPQHFIDEAQPKERKDDASVGAARKIAANIRPEEITSSVTAYTGAPTVNSRGEVIQGNNRSAALREMWDNHQEQGDKYKKYLIDHAESFGLKPEDIAVMDKPVLVNMLDVNDDEAISLGQFVASDTESGGTERIKPKNVVKKLGDKMKNFANILLRANDENISFAELVDSNGVDALKWLNANGVISPTQYKSAFDSKGNITAEAKNDIKGIMYQSIFEGGNTQLEEMFNALPAKAQKAILATAYRDYDSPQSERMIEDIQDSIMAYYALSHDSMFMNAKNHKDVRIAVEAWRRQLAFDDVTGESYLPAEKYSNFALLLATMYKGDNQSLIQGTFNKMYDLIQGTQEETLFEQPDNTPRSLAQAIKETLNIEHNGQQGSNVLAGDSSASQEGRTGSNGDATSRGRSENSDGTETNQGGTEGDSGKIREERVEKADEGAYSLSQQKSDNGENFYQDINGNIDLANIPDEVFNKINKPQAPFRLTPSMLKHVFDRHGKEMGLSKADDAIDFVLDVIDNFDHVRQGEKGAIIFSIENGRSRTGRRAVTVLLDSLSGSYYGIKTSGYERIEGLTKRTLLWEKGAKDTSATGVAPANVPTEQASQSNEPAGSASNHNNDFEGKDKQSSDTKQEIVDNYLEKPARDVDLFAMAERVAEEDKAKRTRKKEEAKVDTNPTEAQKEAGNYRKRYNQLVEDELNNNKDGLTKEEVRRELDTNNESDLYTDAEKALGAKRYEELQKEISDSQLERIQKQLDVENILNNDGQFEYGNPVYDNGYFSFRLDPNGNKYDLSVNTKYYRGQKYNPYYTQKFDNITAKEAERIMKEESKRMLSIGSVVVPLSRMIDELDTTRKQESETQVEHPTERKQEETQPLVMTEEEYLSAKGYPYAGIGEPAMHKGNYRTKSGQRLVKAQNDKDTEYTRKREELRREYKAKLASGEIREPSAVEKLIKSANGHPDNASTQAARRALEKRSIDWKTGSRLQSTEKGFDKISREQSDALVSALEKTGLANSVSVENHEEFVKGLDEQQGAIDLQASQRRDKREEVNRNIDEATSFVTGKPVKDIRKERIEDERKRKQQAKEIYENVLSSNFNDVSLQQINDYINEVTPLNPFGRRLSQRLPQAVERRMYGVSRKDATGDAGKWDALYSRICEASVRPNERFGKAGRRAIEERKKEVLKAWAIATGNWHTDLSDFTDSKEPIASGTDSDVYLSKDGNHVIKLSKGKTKGKFLPDLDNIPLFNYLFPNTAYKIVGYGEINGNFVRILEQPFVDFSNATPLSVDERVAYMDKLGFKPVNEAKTAFSNGEIVAADLQKSNIVKDKNGVVRVIYADVKLHTKDFGGKYTYLPVEEDLPNVGTNRYQAVYHGSGAKFKAFDHSHMSEGEGAQAHGWGTYVAVDENTGRKYANAMLQEKYRENRTINELARERIANDGNKDESLTYLRGLLNEPWCDKKRVKKQIKIIETGKFLPEGATYLYTVDIPDSNGTNYLEEDGRYSMPELESIIHGLQMQGWKIVEDREIPTWERDGKLIVLRDGQKGKDVYAELSDAFGGDKQASEFLYSVGFAGIHYDGRQDRECYVIFNESDLNITHHKRLMKLKDGTVYGYVDAQGNVHLDASVMNGNTPVHEFGHLWNDWCKKNNAELYARGAELIKDSPYYKYADEEAKQPGSAYYGMSEEQLIDEALARAIGDKGEQIQKTHDIFKFATFKAWLGELWSSIKKKFGVGLNENLEDMTLDDFTNIANRDLLNGEPLKADDGRGYSHEELSIIEAAKQGGTYMKAPNGEPTKLTEKQWAQVRTKAFKDWFGDWEKQARIEKLRKAEPVEITGEEYKGKYELNRNSAKQWIKDNLRGEYEIEDTGEKVSLGKVGANKVTSHGMGNEAHIKSIVAIPQLIRDAVFVEERPNEKGKGKFDSYRYYVCGLKIGGVDYTVKLTIGVKQGKRYYDHALTEMEKGKLLDQINGRAVDKSVFGTMPDTKSTNGSGFTTTGDAPLPSYAVSKDTKLLSILQTNSSKVADENGEPMVVYHGTTNEKEIRTWNAKHGWYDTKHEPFTVFKRSNEGIDNQGLFFNSDADNAYGYGSNTYDTYLNLRNPLIIDAKGSMYNDIEHDGENKDTYDWAEYAETKDYDGVIFHNVRDGVDFGNMDKPTDDFVAFRSNQIKSATDNVGTFDEGNVDIRYRDGDGSLTDDELSFANDPMVKMLGKSTRTEEQRKEFAERERQRMVERVKELADTLHLDDVEMVTDTTQLEGKRAKAKGFYSKSTGKITVVIPNHTDMADVEKTLLHEAVAHYGLRKLFGNHFDTFLDNVYNSAEAQIRREIVKLATKNGWDFRTATEEYLAGLAENTNFEKAMSQGWWSKIKQYFLKMLHSLGFDNWQGGEISDNELRYILWRSYENLTEPGRYRSILGQAEDVAMQSKLKVGNYEVKDNQSSKVAEQDVLYRDGEPVDKDRTNARGRYEQRVSRAMFQTQEAIQDSMLGLKEAMDAILKGEGKKMNVADIDGFENAYLGENRLSSVNKAEADAFAHLLFKPMLDEVAKLAKNDKQRTELVDYMMAKHGLERNQVMAERDATEAFKANEQAHPNSTKSFDDYLADARERDYAGLTALTGTDTVEEAEAEAGRMVADYEQNNDTTELWKKVNDVTNATLSKSYECGMMNKDTYDKIKSMYQFYIPLRGFDEKTSSEAYAYLTHSQSAFNAPIKVAKGRTSKADDPFANIQSMAESAITQGNRNKLVKQKFLNFALNHPSDLVSISDMWLKYDDVADEWKPVFPDNFEENDSAEDIEQKLKEFEDKMKKLAEQAPDKYKHGKETANIPYRVVDSRDLRQHQVLVKRGGRDYVLTINGNPRAAQALNGQTNPDNDTSGAIGAILRAGEMVNRQLSAFYTTRNPDFVVSNFIRDMLFSNSIVWVKESPNYALRFHRNIARCNPAQIKVLLAKHRKGTLDMNNKLEHMFYQFMMNGGETGYANVRDIEQHKNDIRRELKRANGKLSITKAFNLLGEKLDEYNRAVENCARFAAYLTSREMGRTVERSIYDAKEISVNFNKKGSGAKFMNAVGQTKIGTASAFVSGIGRSGFVFWNAAIQGTTNFGRQFKKHPAKAFTASAIMFLLGAVIAGIGMGDGDDDADANSYWNLPEYVRRSNILFKIGDQWVSIPLPVEYRAIYGMGELMVSAMSGKEHFTGSELGKAMAGQATQVLPIDFLEGGGGVKAFVPSAVKPFAEVYSNKSWTGMPIYKDTPYNKYMPEWTKAYKSANKYLVGIAKTLNEATGGDAYTKGSVDINPAQIEYLLNGYFGGVSGTIDKLSKSAETIAGDREYDPRNFLLLNRILKNGDERTEARAINNEYMRVKEEHDVLKARMKHYENDTDKGIFDYADKIDFLYNSPEFARYEIFEDYSKDIDALYKELKEANDGAEHLSIEKELTELKKEMIEEMNKTRK